MDRINQIKGSDHKAKVTTFSIPIFKDSRKIIIDLIVDRIMEDQQNGNLRLRTKTNY